MSDENQQDTALARTQPDSEEVPTTELIRRGAGLPAEEWNREKVAAAMKLLPKGFRQPQHVIAYLARAQRTGLDPFLGEIHAWEDKGELTFHTDISGWVEIAKSDPDIEGVEASVIREGDDFMWERRQDGSVVVNHKGGLGGDPVGAYCVVHMEREPDHIEIRRMEDYDHLMGKKNWRNHPSDMILIRAYEAAVSKKSTKAAGIYAKDSFEMSNKGEIAGKVQRQVAGEATDATEEELAGKLEEASAGRDVTPPPASSGEEPEEEPEASPAPTPEPSPEETPSEETETPESDTSASESEVEADDEPLDFRKHTEGIPDGYAVIEAVFPDHSDYMPCTVDEEGLPDTQLLDEGTCSSMDAAKRIIQANVDRPQPEEEEDADTVERGGTDDTPRQPCPICGEYLQPRQMGGHKSGHSKKNETLPSDDYRVRMVEEDGEKTYQWLHTGVIMEGGLPNYETALALIWKHYEGEYEAEEQEPDQENRVSEDDMEAFGDEEEPEEEELSETDRWQAAFERVHTVMRKHDLTKDDLIEAVEEVNPQAINQRGAPKLSAMTSDELRQVGDNLDPNRA